MNENMNSVSRLFRLAKAARNLGLFILGLSIYLVALLAIIWVLVKGVMIGKWNAAEAVALATFATTTLHWFLYIFSI